MTSITLPISPKSFEFEDFISAHFQSGGYYIERNIVQKETDIVLELDIITTNYDNMTPEIQIIEVKSGDWGFPDIFKLRGWMDYLNIQNSGFIAQKINRNPNFFRDKAESLNVKLLVVSDLDQSKEILSEIVGDVEILDSDTSTWRYSYWVERNLLKHLKNCKKTHPEKKCYQNMDEYQFEINSGVFFTGNITEKAIRLYEAFKKYPKLSAKCGNELNGLDFDEEHDTIPQNIFKNTFYSCDYNEIQISTYIEHRARLSVLKSAIDYLLYKEAGITEKIKDDIIFHLEGDDLRLKSTSFDLLPWTFRQGLDEISKHRYFHRYAIFWQWFFWIFGGFILKDFEELEYQILSQKSGIPVEEIPKAFESYQILFPTEGGWFLNPKNSNIRVMKMFPVPFMGIGVYYRRYIHTKSGEFKDLKVTGNHTQRDLSKWTKLTAEVIKESCDISCISDESG